MAFWAISRSSGALFYILVRSRCTKKVQTLILSGRNSEPAGGGIGAVGGSMRQACSESGCTWAVVFAVPQRIS